MDALAALDQAVDPVVVYDLPRGETPSRFEIEIGRIDAIFRWRRYLRHPVLFAAIAAEGFVNEFLAGHLTKTAFRRVDRLTPVDKYTKGTAAAIGRPLFAPDDDLIVKLDRLAKLRNALAHPKVGYGFIGSHDDENWDADYLPASTIDLIVAVAEASEILAEHAAVPAPEESTRAVALLILGAPQVLRSFALRHVAPPLPHQREDHPLFHQLHRAKLGSWVDPNLDPNRLPDLEVEDAND